LAQHLAATRFDQIGSHGCLHQGAAQVRTQWRYVQGRRCPDSVWSRRGPASGHAFGTPPTRHTARGTCRRRRRGGRKGPCKRCRSRNREASRPRAAAQAGAPGNSTRGCLMRATLRVLQHDTRAFLRQLQARMRQEPELGGLFPVVRLNEPATDARGAGAPIHDQADVHLTSWLGLRMKDPLPSCAARGRESAEPLRSTQTNGATDTRVPASH